MELKRKKIFITGGAGFIANKLIQRIIEDNQIVVFDNFFRDTLSTSSCANHKNLSIVRGDVRDFPAVKQAMHGCNIVVHAAAIAGIDTVIKSPITTMEVNMIGTANVLRAASELKVYDRVMDFSTSEVFGSHALNSGEDDKAVTGSAGEARWTYAVSKLSGEHLTHAYYSEKDLPTVTIRPFNVYGPGQTGEGALQIFIRRALKNEPITIYGDGSQIRAWCYIDDMVNALILALEKEEAIGETFNIGNSRAVTTIFGLAQTVCRVLNSSSKILFAPPLSADIELRIPKTDKALNVLGFKAVTDLEKGIRKTADWYLKRSDSNL